MVHDAKWAFHAECSHNFSTHDASMIAANMHVWYFENGASKHVASHYELSSCFEIALLVKTIMRANNLIYLAKATGKVN